jgi:dolichol-phosphate mannosyltransferase
MDCRWRIVFVDDGSHDGTTDFVQALHEADNRIELLQLSRNFGQPAAITAGLAATSGDCVVVMDGDLQDPPELIPRLFDAWQGGGEVVIARRTSRGERGLRGLALRSFHRAFQYLADAAIPPNTGTFCLLDRLAVEAIRAMPECHRFFPGLRARAGFAQVLLDYDRPDRAAGTPKQSLRRLIRYAADAVFSFSFKPLRLVTLSGTAVCGLALALALFFLTKRLLGWEVASLGFTTLTCCVLGLGGCQLVAIGILGEYLGRIYEEVKRRPTYFLADPDAQRRENRDIDASHRRSAA